jgi:hypothetical protein
MPSKRVKYLLALGVVLCGYIFQQKLVDVSGLPRWKSLLISGGMVVTLLFITFVVAPLLIEKAHAVVRRGRVK